MIKTKKNVFPMPNHQSEWVCSTLSSMTTEQKIGQMLHPNLRPFFTTEEIDKLLPEGVDVGGVFIFNGSSADYNRVTTYIQDRSRIPVIMSSDLECGAGRMIKDATVFPDLMSLPAAAESATAPAGLAETMGRATAIEGRANGIHWTFGPVVDINVNPYNPITNTRSLGDRPETITRLAGELIEGMQANGLAACAKHFPGDGWDDRDQHLCTTINPLNMEQWFATSGKMFSDAIAAGVWTIMIGHVALPACDAGIPGDPMGPPPATISKKITTGLLRETMGFKGLIVSDALEMGGLVSHCTSARDLIIKTINAGNDMLLFCNGRRDFEYILDAVKNGEITIERINDAVSRILAVKEVLGFAEDAASAKARGTLPESITTEFAACSQAIAKNAMTMVKNTTPSKLPLNLQKDDEVFVLHLRSNPEYNVDGFDTLLEKEGIKVYRQTEADASKWYHAGENYDRFKAIIILWTQGPTFGTDSIRPAGVYMRMPWGVIRHFPNCPVVHVSFGNPYIVHDIPWGQVILNAYSPDPRSQQAALDVLLGRADAPGKSPVDLNRPAMFRSLLARDLLG